MTALRAHSTWLRVAVLALTMGAAVSGAETAPGFDARATAEAVERAHREMWRRFIAADGTVLDFADLNGAVSLPTAEECRDMKPSAMGWWTPIENGGFFGGLYLDALCNRWRATRAEADAARARQIAAGLLKLAATRGPPGFVARGFASDGVSHYPASSSDQTFPWFYGLYRYATSGLPAEDERARVVAVLEGVALGLQANGWRMPIAARDFGHFGQWATGFIGQGTLTGAEPQFDATTRFLFVLRALAELTGRGYWLDRYEEALAGKPEASERTRLEISAGGVAYVAPGEPPRYPESPNLWTSAASQAALRALWEMERRPEVRARFRAGLDTNARSAARFIAGHRTYDNANGEIFDVDWRKLNASWRPQANIAEAVKLASAEYRVWKTISPRKVTESEKMRDPLFAAWVVVLAGNDEITQAAAREVHAALTHFRWERLYTSFFFMAECVYWQLGPR